MTEIRFFLKSTFVLEITQVGVNVSRLPVTGQARKSCGSKRKQFRLVTFMKKANRWAFAKTNPRRGSPV